MENNYRKSVFFMIMSGLAGACMALMVKLAGDVPVFEKVLFRKFITIFIALIFIIKNGDPLLGKKENRPLLILRGVLGFIGVSLYFYGLTHLNISDASMLNKLSPFFVILFAALILKEKLNKEQIIAILVAFIASLFIIKPKFDIAILPALSGFSSAIFAGLAYTLIRLLKIRGEKSSTIVFYFAVIGFLATLPFVIKDFVMPVGSQWLFLLGIGVFAGIGQLFMTEAYHYAKASSVAPYKYMHVLFSAILGIIYLQEFPDIWSIVGSLFIVAAFIFLYRKERQAKTNLMSSK